MGHTRQTNTNSVYIVNGFADKCDANFIGQFYITNLDNDLLVIGNYPCQFDDVNKIAQC